MGIFDNISTEDFIKFILPRKYDILYEDRQNTMKKVYMIIFVIYTVIGVLSLICFCYLKNWYIIKQRGFGLTLLNGVFAFLSGFTSLMTQFVNIPCGFGLYLTNVINPFYNALFLSRSLRVVLLYHFNIFKVTAIKKRNKKRREYYVTGESEPNYYLPKVYKKVNNIIYFVIAIPTIIAFVITLIKHIRHFEDCQFTSELNATELLKTNNSASLFNVAQYAGVIMAVSMSIMFIFVCKIKDNSKYGVKFECMSTIILIVVLTIFNMFLNMNIQSVVSKYNALMNTKYSRMGFEDLIKNLNENEDKDFRKPYILYYIYDYTKGGRILFTIITMYMIFSSIILPCIKCYSSKREKNKYFHEPTSSIQYFYKVLNSPPLVEELKSIAIKEYSVENVLFWENYQVLQKMVYRYQIEYKKAERIGNPKLVSQYDFEGYYQQQIQSFSISSMDDYSYDPNMPVPSEIMPYYLNFYKTFIDSLGPASVNISGSAIKRIYNEICTYPTIGMFDHAKNEIVEMMYSSIFPILLRQNRKQLRSSVIHY